MHAGRHYTLKEFLVWTRREIYFVSVLSILPTILYQVLGWKWLGIPWLPIAMVGTASAFLIGFKNNATYDRLWEARTIYGAIVNASRAWGVMVRDFISNRHAAVPVSEEELKAIHRRLIYRHIAWLTALRFQLREPRSWENMKRIDNVEYSRHYHIPEKNSKLDDELKPLLSEEDLEYILSKKNRAAQLISLQSKELAELHARGLLDNFRHIEMERAVAGLYDQQGRCERIKNFPYPRQFVTISTFFIFLFIIMVPFGMLQEFEKLGTHRVWLTIPFSVLVSWVFIGMEKIGESTENPFEGGANDVPITALSRTIEIDLRDMMDEKDLPPALQPENKILM